jgi:hypothetical protein
MFSESRSSQAPKHTKVRTRNTCLRAPTIWEFAPEALETEKARDQDYRGLIPNTADPLLDAPTAVADLLDGPLHRGSRLPRSELRVIDIMAEPGIGKSRLLREFRQRVGKERAFILAGSCSPDGRQTPFLPFIEVVRGSFRVSVGEPEKDVAQNTEIVELQRLLFEIVLHPMSASPLGRAPTVSPSMCVLL